MTPRQLTPLGGLLVLALAMAGCGDSPGTPGETGPAGDPGQPGATGTASLIDVETVEPGSDCAHGGMRINTGLDADQSGDLSGDEITAGSSMVQCNPEPAETCAETVTINGVTGADGEFVEGVSSSALSVDLSTIANVELVLLGPDFDFTSGANPGEFSVTPLSAGGPYFITVIATNGCSVDQTSITIATVDGPS
jgi:hypothetical protein